MAFLRFLLCSLLFVSCGIQNQTGSNQLSAENSEIPKTNDHLRIFEVRQSSASSFDIILNTENNTISFEGSFEGVQNKMSLNADDWWRCANTYKTPDIDRLPGSRQDAAAQASALAKLQKFAVDSLFSIFNNETQQKFIEKYTANPYGLSFNMESTSYIIPVEVTDSKAELITYLWQFPFSPEAKRTCSNRNIDFSDTVYIPGR